MEEMECSGQCEEGSDYTDDDSDEEDDDEEPTITYIDTVNKEPFEEWLNSHLPSSVNRDRDGIEWIRVALPNKKEWEDTFAAMDLEGLMIAWGQMIKSGRLINFQSILELASNYHVTCGKWMFFTETGAKIDFLWQKVATGVIYRNSPVLDSAKVSTFHEDGDGRHVVCIYNADFRNREQVLQLEHAIRNIGIKCMLIYKPDVYTYLGVYKKNPWGLRPTIIKSMFDIKTGNSVITSDVFEI